MLICLFSFHFTIYAEGSKDGGVNPKGIAFYNNLINELRANGCESTSTNNY